MLYKKCKKSISFLIVAIFLLSLTAVLSVPAVASTKIGDAGLSQTGQKAFGVNQTSGIPFAVIGIPGIVGLLLGVALSLVGVLFLVLTIYGGILWMTARGNEQQIEKAKDLIIASVIGLVIVLGAYAITAFIGGALAPK